MFNSKPKRESIYCFYLFIYYSLVCRRNLYLIYAELAWFRIEIYVKEFPKQSSYMIDMSAIKRNKVKEIKDLSFYIWRMIIELQHFSIIAIQMSKN